MTQAVVCTRAIDGLNAPLVRVLVQVEPGKSGFSVDGRSNGVASEVRDRIFRALAACGHEVPSETRVEVTLTPANLPNESGRFDLAIALAALAAHGALDQAALDPFEFVASLGARGEILPIRGALPMALALRHEGTPHALVLAESSAREAALADGVDVWSARTFGDVVAALKHDTPQRPLPRAVPLTPPLATHPLDMRDIRGQANAKRALEIAAAGNHHVLMLGPPSTAKSMLAERLRGLLPPLAANEALASAAMASLAGVFDSESFTVRPHRAVHERTTEEALCGGGSPLIPGELSLAYAGVLFVDELPALSDAGLQALGEALKNGKVKRSSQAHAEAFPARFQLVAGMRACPCGYAGARVESGQMCQCDSSEIRRYQERVPAALRESIDLRVDVLAVRHGELTGAPDGESTATIAARVLRARARQITRQAGLNADLEGDALRTQCVLDEVGNRLLLQAAEQSKMSPARMERVLKVARTVADLAGRKTIASMHLAEALRYQVAVPA